MQQSGFYAAMSMAWVLSWAVILLVIWHLRAKRRQKRQEWIHQERMMALEKGIPLPELPSLEENGGRKMFSFDRPVNPRWPLGVSAILISGGIGTALAMFLSGNSEYKQVWSFGLIPVFLGIGLVLHYRLTRNSSS
jgi:hypothetical protein